MLPREAQAAPMTARRQKMRTTRHGRPRARATARWRRDRPIDLLEA